MYYRVKVKVGVDTGKGVKYNSEYYLVEAQSVTDAEATTVQDLTDDGIEFEVVEVKKSEICKVLG
jgi:mannose/fructose/N-acetylgalactosamine-specific phosphotransferase system component IIB|tara:strand:- start:344 stop:538 length:195 start_codon:yes stop_codon:yes gene_type:complete